MRIRVLLATMLLGTTLAVAGCGGDNLSLCDDCDKPTPTVTPTPVPSATATPVGG
jgi:hypothetical protein